MPRLQTLFECIAFGMVKERFPQLQPGEPVHEPLLKLAECSHHLVTSQLSQGDVRAALREAVSAPLETIELALRDAVHQLTTEYPNADRDAISRYLEQLPGHIRQLLRRPDDPAGTTLPESFSIENPDDWLLFLPDRAQVMHSNQKCVDLEGWTLTDFRGTGIAGETWRAWNDSHPETPTACLKFITLPALKKGFDRYVDYFQHILDVEPIKGLVPLRSVYFLVDPPCLEWDFVAGYDLAGLMRDWRWRYSSTKPDYAVSIIRRIAGVVAKLHMRDHPLTHRGLKPTNILLHPTSDGKVSISVSDLGWGAISSAYGLKYLKEDQTHRLSLRGSNPFLYASPQQRAGQKPDPRDDVYALGVIWYQLLKRNPAAKPPEGCEWTLKFRKAGLSDALARILVSCLSPNAEERPANARALADLIDANRSELESDDSRRIQVKATSPPKPKSPASNPAPVVRRSTRSAIALLEAKLPSLITNSIGMEFALIRAGEFIMGSPKTEKGRHDWEGPQHRVVITRPFYLGIYPITQAQYEAVMHKNPAHFQRALGGSPQHPVEHVSWQDAVEFCERLSAFPLEAEACRLYRLPTEAEWEYACRAGTTTAFCFGESVTLQQVHFFGLSADTWAKEATSVGKTQKVGSHPPNPWGLYDMHGNVLEWCEDWWDPAYYAQSPEEDPTGPVTGFQRVVRGGSFSQFVADSRSAARLGRAPSTRLNTIGFRVAITIPGMD